MKLIKYCFSLLLLSFSVGVYGQNWSYVYIQGDKETPFYVKLEGEMLPRYSKNYYIIPQLAAGAINIQVLFQQNEYQPQSFKVLVPENGHRGFLLTKKDQGFALYDLQQKFYLMPAGGEDRLPEVDLQPNAAPVKATVAATGEQDMLKQAFGTKETKDPNFLENVVLANEHVPPVSATDTATLPADDSEIAEVTNISPEAATSTTENPTSTPEETATISNEPVETQEVPVAPIEEPVVAAEPTPVVSPTNEPEIRTEDNYAVPPAPSPVAPSVPVVIPPQPTFSPGPAVREATVKKTVNAECPEPISQGAFDQIYSSTKNKDDDESRISYLMKTVKSSCFSTQQIYFLTRELQAESMRYSFLKKAYPKISDQYNFRQLEDHLFKTLEWKSYFRLIYQ